MRTARLILTLVLVPMILSAAALAAQEIQGLPEPTALAQQNLRPYVHVFIAYAIVIVIMATIVVGQLVLFYKRGWFR